MNQADRLITCQLYRLLDRMTSIGPGNPAYTESMAPALKRVNQASIFMARTLLYLHDRDYAEAQSSINEAKAILEKDKEVTP